jgi:hypothetical protein
VKTVVPIKKHPVPATATRQRMRTGAAIKPASKPKPWLMLVGEFFSQRLIPSWIVARCFDDVHSAAMRVAKPDCYAHGD